MHDPEFAPSYEVIVEETLPALHRLQSEGVIKRIGMGMSSVISSTSCSIVLFVLLRDDWLPAAGGQGHHLQE